MIHRKQCKIAAFALLVTSVTAYGQANPKVQQRREAINEAVREAIKAIGLDRDQVAKLQEIRWERPRKGTQDAEALSGFEWVRIESVSERTCRENGSIRP